MVLRQLCVVHQASHAGQVQGSESRLAKAHDRRLLAPEAL